MRVLIVIVNYRTPGLTIDCLKSLEPELASFAPGEVHVVVTDNASPDDSVLKLTQAIADQRWSNWCTLLPLPKNGGFAYGNNEGIGRFLDTPARRHGGTKNENRASSPSTPSSLRAAVPACLSSPDYVYLLNPDTIVLPGAVRELVQFMDHHPLCGIAGGRAENPDGTVRRTVFRFHSVLSEVEGTLRIGPVTRALKRHIVAPPTPNHAVQSDWVSGASMMLRREMIEQIGLLDDGYFMYYEETDYCLRAARNGWQTWYVPQSRIIHLVGQSSGVTGAQRSIKRRPRYWFESRHRYYRKNLGAIPTLAADMLWVVNYPISRLYQKLRKQPRVDPPWLWWDFIRYNFGAWTR
jgi:GT2 family glycosyltransferase